MSSLLNLDYTFTLGTRYLIDLGFICIEEWNVNDNLVKVGLPKTKTGSKINNMYDHNPIFDDLICSATMHRLLVLVIHVIFFWMDFDVG